MWLPVLRDGTEAALHDRALIAANGKSASWYQPDDPFHCAKGLWTYPGSGAEAIFFEANRQRPHCDGFHRWVHGRDPEAHFQLEDEARGFKHQSRLAWRSFWGGLIGAAIGAGLLALVGRLFD